MTSFFDFQAELNARKAAARRPRASSDVASASPVAGEAPLSVSQLTAQIDKVLKAGLPAVLHVRGEVSNFKFHTASGHAYFTLKDPDACINCVMFKTDFSRVKFQPGDGMELLVTGRVSVYAQRGSYQFYVSRMEPLGQGALELAFRQLCEKLEAEGLFAQERKKPIPLFPNRIALVTSRQTAALQDMLKVLRRFPWLNLVLYHVPVQGDGAAIQIAQAIRDLHEHGRGLGIDLIILGRGGGSLEDLWPFNEEVVARAMVACDIPIITGIGHEIDVSIADLVADHHAHTPTEAAQGATTRWRTAVDDVDALSSRLGNALRSRVQEARSSLVNIERHEFFRRPTDIVEELRQRLDDLQQGMDLALEDQVSDARHKLSTLALRLAECTPRHLLARKLQQLAAAEIRLQQHHPRQLLALKTQQVDAMQARLDLAVRSRLGQTRSRLELLDRHLNAVGPQQVLARGYTITTFKKGGVILRSKSQVKGGERLITHVVDGEVESIAEDPDQPTLF